MSDVDQEGRDPELRQELKKLVPLLDAKERHEERRQGELFVATPEAAEELVARRDYWLERLASVKQIDEALTEESFRREVVDVLTTDLYRRGRDVDIRVLRELRLRDVLDWRRRQ